MRSKKFLKIRNAGILVSVFIFVFLAVGINNSNAVAPFRSSVQCTGGVTPQVELKWNDWGDYGQTGPIKEWVLYKGDYKKDRFGSIELYRVNYTDFSTVHSYTDTSVSNKDSVTYTLRRIGFSGEDYVTSTLYIKCGQEIVLNTNMVVGWTISASGELYTGVSGGSGESKSIFVQGNKTYTISFDNPSGYTLHYINTRNLFAPYKDTYGLYKFNVQPPNVGFNKNADKSVKAYFTKTSIPRAQLFCLPKVSYISWAPIDGASSYKIFYDKNGAPVNTIGVVSGNGNGDELSAILNMPIGALKDDEIRYKVSAYDSSGDVISTTGPSNPIKYDCTFNTEITANIDGGSWNVVSKIGSSILYNETGSGLSGSYNPITSNSYTNWDGIERGLSNYIEIKPYAGMKILNINGQKPILDSNGFATVQNFSSTNSQIDYFIEWEAIPVPILYNTSSTGAQICSKTNPSNPQVDLSWNISSSPELQNVGWQITRIGDDGSSNTFSIPAGIFTYTDTLSETDVGITYDYTLQYITNNSNSDSSNTISITIASCLVEPPPPTQTATLGVTSNVPEAGWDVTNVDTGNIVFSGLDSISGQNVNVNVNDTGTDFTIGVSDVSGYLPAQISDNSGPLNQNNPIITLNPNESNTFILKYDIDPNANPSSVNITATPDVLTKGDGTLLEWTSENVVTCSASGDWSGGKDVAGSEWILNIQNDSTFTIECQNEAGEIFTDSATVEVQTQCNNGIDDDGDGLIDLDDGGCPTVDDNSENEPPVITLKPPNPMELNLGDAYEEPGYTVKDDQININLKTVVEVTGTVDTNTIGNYTLAYDVDDLGTPPLSAVTKYRQINVVDSGIPPKKQCKDGVDNDGDGLIDFPNDPGCKNETDDSEDNGGGGTRQCNNGIDDDGDRLIDFSGGTLPDGTEVGRDPECKDINDNSEDGGGGSIPVIVSLSANPTIIEGSGSVTLSWSNQNVVNCVALEGPWSGEWSGLDALNGSQLSPNISVSTTFKIKCEDSSGNKKIGSTFVLVTSPPVNPDYNLFSTEIMKIDTGTGASSPTTIIVSPINGFNEAVDLEIKSIPPSLSNAVIKLTNKTQDSNEYNNNVGSVLTVELTEAIPSSSYSIEIGGTSSSGISRKVFVNLNVINNNGRKIEEF